MRKEAHSPFVCVDCVRLRRCSQTTASWIFFFIALVAVVSLRVMVLFTTTNPALARGFWYLGVIGFLVFFLYKFRHDHLMHRELQATHLLDKVMERRSFDDHDYAVLATVLCRSLSRKDKINYFFIFFFSGIALVWALYMDLIR